MRDNLGIERSICLHCAANDKECLEYHPACIELDLIEKGEVDWELDVNKLSSNEEPSIMPCILHSIEDYAKQNQLRAEDFKVSRKSTSLKSETRPAQQKKNSVICKPVKSAKPEPCACGCPPEAHQTEHVTETEGRLLAKVRPYLQMVKLSYSVMQSVNDTVTLDISRREFTYGEVYDVAYLRFLNYLYGKYFVPKKKWFQTSSSWTEEWKGGRCESDKGPQPKSSTGNNNSSEEISSPILLRDVLSPVKVPPKGETETFSPLLENLYNKGRPLSRHGSFYDLGCGTGKATLLAALSKWAFEESVGVELLPGLYHLAKCLEKTVGLPSNLTRFEMEDISKVIIPENCKMIYIAATVFGPELLKKIRYQTLRRVQPGCIVITLKNKLPEVEVLEETELLVSWGISKCYVCRIPIGEEGLGGNQEDAYIKGDEGAGDGGTETT